MCPECVNCKDSKFDFIQADLSAELGGLTSYSVGLFSGKRRQAFRFFILFYFATARVLVSQKRDTLGASYHYWIALDLLGYC